MLRAKVLWVGIIIAVVFATACTAGDLDGATSKRAKKADAQRQKAGEVAAKKDSHGHDDGHGHGAASSPDEIPAFQTEPAALKNLPPTLSPDLFTGKQRQGYEAAKAIPQTIAQLPCYCHCDKGFGHKSLHSCFVDDHAAHCAICIDEALLAYQLEKGERLRPEQIRERIIAQYTNRQ